MLNAKKEQNAYEAVAVAGAIELESGAERGTVSSRGKFPVSLALLNPNHDEMEVR